MECKEAKNIQNNHCITFKNILIIEKSSTLSHHLKAEIDNYFSFHCDIASSKKEAAEMIGRKKYDLIITDIFISDSEGDIIEELVNGGHHVIVMTSDESEERRSEILNFSIVDYVLKHDIKTLVRYLTKTIERLNANRNTVIGICDDSRFARALMAQLIRSQNLGYIEFGNGQEVVDCMSENKNRIDILLLDYEMPKLNGLETVQRIRHRYLIDELPVIALSASDKPSLVVQFLKSGASDYLHKPFGNEEFLTRLNLTLDHLYTNRENIRLVEELKKNASHDFLTQLYNRTYFFSQIKHIIANALHKETSYGILMIDIDYFKKVNDTYGHNAGDKAIVHIASLLKFEARASDYCFRWGGEEFLVLIPSATAEELLEFGERFRNVVEKSNVYVEESNHVFQITISVGGAVGLEPDVTRLMIEADEMLYEAKASGRNCVKIKGIHG